MNCLVFESWLRDCFWGEMGDGVRISMQVLDVGCGIGGPLREICRISGANVTGLNNNAYQISRGEVLNKKAGPFVSGRCDFMKADFMNIPSSDNTFDAVYEIEATCHAPDAQACYAEVLRVLKPGGYFSGYEWVRAVFLITSRLDDALAAATSTLHFSIYRF